MEQSFTQVTRQTNNKMGRWGEAGSTCCTNRAALTKPSPLAPPPALPPSPISPFLYAQHTPPTPLPRLVAALVASSGRPSLDGQSLSSQLIGLISQLPKGNFLECGLALLLELDGHPANITQIQLLDDSLWLVCPFWTQLVAAKEIPFIYFFVVYLIIYLTNIYIELSRNKANTFLSTLHIFINLVLMINQWGKYNYFPIMQMRKLRHTE